MTGHLKNIIYLFLAVPSLMLRLFSGHGKHCRLLIVVASLVVEHRL